MRPLVLSGGFTRSIISSSSVANVDPAGPPPQTTASTTSGTDGEVPDIAIGGTSAAIQRASVPCSGDGRAAGTQPAAVARTARGRHLRARLRRAHIRGDRDMIARRTGVRRGRQILCSGFIHMTGFHDAA